MSSFGERMRREREMRGITLEAISEKTKITTRTLEALEKDDFDKLPGGIFNKGFVRSYAQFLGMNEEQVLKDFIAVAGDPEQPLPDPPVKQEEVPQPKEPRPWGRIALAATAAVLVLYGSWKLAPKARALALGALPRVHTSVKGRSLNAAADSQTSESGQQISVSQQDPAAATGVTNSAQPQTASQPAATLQQAKQTTTVPAADAPQLTAAPARNDRFVVLVKAKRPAWVSITADGKPVIEGELKRKKKIRAYSQVIVKTNNAGALAYSENGHPLQSLGRDDQQTTVTFTPDGIVR